MRLLWYNSPERFAHMAVRLPGWPWLTVTGAPEDDGQSVKRAAFCIGPFPTTVAGQSADPSDRRPHMSLLADAHQKAARCVKHQRGRTCWLSWHAKAGRLRGSGRL